MKILRHKLILTSLTTFLFNVNLFSQATLPVTRTTWNAGAPTGWTDSGTGSYTSTFACSGSNGGRLDDAGDFYQVFFNAAPDQLDYELNITAAATSSCLVEESPDGTTWSTVVNHTALPISCTAYNHTLLAGTRYVKWTYTKVTQNLTIDDVSITAGGSPTCNISSSGVANIVCNNTGSDFDPSNDYITFDLNPIGSVLGATYTVSVPGGYIISPTSASYGSATTFTLNNGSAGGGDVDVTITDVTGSPCTLVQTITDPGSCSSNDCGSETFDLSNATGSYLDNNYVGDNGVTWTYTESRDESTYGITGNGLMLRDVNSTLLSSSVAGGIGNFTCSLRKAFTGAGNRQVELFVNGVSQGTSIAWDNTNVQTFTVNNIDITGNVIVEIRNITGNQVIIDDIVWTCYSCVTPIDVSSLVSSSSCGNVSLGWNIVSCADEVLVVARENSAVSATPTGDGSAYTADLDFTGAGTPILAGQKVVYKGLSNSINVTNITGTAHFEVFSRIGTTWSSGVSTSVAVDASIPNPIGFSANNSCGNVDLTWVLPSCFDQVLVVARDGSAVTATPTGDGSAYTADANFSGAGTPILAGQKVIYKGAGSSVNISGLTNGNTYHFEIFTRKGTTWSSGVTTSVLVSGSGSGPTTFAPGDIVFVGYDSYKIGTPSNGIDVFSILSLVDIGSGTKFIIANLLFESNAPASTRTYKWYDCSESFDQEPPYLELTYTGCADIPKGSIICIETNTFPATLKSIAVNGVDASADFGTSGFPVASPEAGNISTSSPDAMWFMQGSFSANFTEPDGNDVDALDDNFRYFDGTVLGALQTKGNFRAFSLDGNAVEGVSRISRIHPDVECLYLETGPTSSSRFFGYHDPASSAVTSGTYYDILSSVINPTHWNIQSGTGGTQDNDNISSIKCGSAYTVTGTGKSDAGQWIGGVSTDWFDCRNWANFSVPDENISVKINSASTDNCEIDFNSPKAIEHGNVGNCDTITISDYSLIIDTYGDSLNVKGDLTLVSPGVLNMDGVTATDGDIYIDGNWSNTNSAAAFLDGDGRINFIGLNDQTITTSGFEEKFDHIYIEKNAGNVILNNNIQVETELYFQKGNVETQGNRVFVSNTNTNAIVNYSATNGYVFGNLRRNVLAGNDYPYPVGYSNTTTDYHLAEIINTSLVGVSFIDGKVDNLTEAGNNIDSRIPLTLIQTGVGRLINIHSEAVWSFTPNTAPSGGSYGVNLYEMNVSPLTDDLFVPAKRDAASTDYADWDIFDATTTIPAAGAPGRVTNGGLGYAQRLGYTDFSQHAISDVVIVLSIKELTLKAKLNELDNNVNLTWYPSVEGNVNGKFELLRSDNGKDFIVISTKTFNPELKEYSYLDKDINSTKVYYKVRFKSSNDIIYSNTEIISLDGGFKFSVYPNPNNGNFTISFNSNLEQAVEYSIYDMLGRQIVSKSLVIGGNISELVVLPNVESGIYMLQINTSTTKEVIKLTVKN